MCPDTNQAIKNILAALARSRHALRDVKQRPSEQVWECEEAIVAAERAVTKLKFHARGVTTWV